MATTQVYDSHDFDEHVREGSALRNIHGARLTQEVLQSKERLYSSAKYPVIYTVAGTFLFSGAFWTAVALLFL